LQQQYTADPIQVSPSLFELEQVSFPDCKRPAMAPIDNWMRRVRKKQWLKRKSQ
jgi:hypothetical protein